MEKRLQIGVSDFRVLREGGCFYMDKSLFIREFWKRPGKLLYWPDRDISERRLI